ncbi:MAG: hypothetical protein RL410_789, partial [Actinomycetota bacterium]
MTLQERLTYVGFRTAWSVCARLPDVVVKTAFQFIADISFGRNGVGAKRLRFNIARVLGKEPTSAEVIEISRQALRSYFRYWAD